MKTYHPKAKDIKRSWHLVDAKGEILGRVASKLTKYLTGKHKVDYSPHMDMGDFVVVVNAKAVEVTGRKEKQKVYRKHSGYPDGFKELKYHQLMDKDPAKIIKLAVSGMLPKNRLHKKRMARLRVFEDDKHPYGDKVKTVG